MKYKVGDKVRVRQWDDMAKEFGVDEFGNIDTKTGCYFTKQMKEFCGGVYEIDSVLEKGYWLKDGYKYSHHWYFTNDMLEDVVPPSLKPSLLFFIDNKFAFELKDGKNFIKSKTPETPKTQKESEEKMKKQMTQRERLEGQLKEYQRDSGINLIEIIVPGKIVKVTMNDNDTYTMKCQEDDEFSLEKAIIIAYVKNNRGGFLTPDGIEYEAERFTHFKDNMKKLKKAMKVYEIQQKLKALDEEEERIRANKKKKKIDQKQRRAERLAEEKLKETKEAAKIYADALRSAFSDCEISEDTVENIVKDMSVRM